MNTKVAIFVIGIVIAAGLVGLVSTVGHDTSDEDCYSGDWYEVYAETGQIVGSVGITIKEYSLDDKHDPFVVKSISKNMIYAEFNHVPVLGGIVDGFILFEVVDGAQDLYAYVEGCFDGNVLTMAVIKYEDSTFSKVVSGTHSKYVHESCETIPDTQGYFDAKSRAFENGRGSTYVIDPSSNEITESIMDAPTLEVVEQKYMVDISVNRNLYGQDVYSVNIFTGIYDGRVTAIFACSTAGRVFTGDLTIADGVARIVADVYFTSNAERGKYMAYIDISYDVDYYHGKRGESVDLSGDWEGDSYIYDGVTLRSHISSVTKTISSSGSCFASVENVASQGGVRAYTWMGNVIDGEVSVLTLYGGSYSALYGYVDGDHLYLSGYIDRGGHYEAIHFVLKRVN